MSYRRLTLKNRYQIEAYLSSGLSIRTISKKLGVCASSISRELKKTEKDNYLAESAQQITTQRNTRRFKKRYKIKGSLENYVRAKLLQDWSPEQIVGRLKLEDPTQRISHQSIYRFIAREKKIHGSLWKHLRILRKQRKDRTKVGWKPCPEPLKERQFIQDRPKIVETRQRLGDLERDSLLGKANGSLLLTIVDRKSRLLRLQWLPQKSSRLIHKATIQALKKTKTHTITNDNGTEFARHQQTAKELNISIYFSRAFRSWERGTNENLNGLIRQYFPRRKDIGRPSSKHLRSIETKINSRPRKCLGYKTPIEIHTSS